MNAHAAGSRARELYAWQNRVRVRIRRRLGYRGLILLMFGLIYIMIGLSVPGTNDYAADLVHTHLPIWFRITLWCLPGAVAAALCLDHRWQAIGFAFLFIPPSERALSFLIGTFSGGGLMRVPGFLIYTLILLTVTFVAAWPEPTALEKDISAQEPGRLSEGDHDSEKYLDRDGVLRDPRTDD